MTENCQNVNELSQMALYDEGKGKHCFGPLEVSNRDNGNDTASGSRRSE